MNMKNTLLIIIMASTWLVLPATVHANLPVIDVSVLAQSIQEVVIATEQVKQITAEVKRLGDPATILPQSADQIISSLGQTGVGKSWHELRLLADGTAALAYDGNGLYKVIGQNITTSDGAQVIRQVDDYKKFDAIAQATSTLEEVMKDTEGRRQQVRDQIRSTTDQLKNAQTLAEVQKLQGVLNAQSAELGAIDRVREAALNHVVVQMVENETDAAKQEQARKEERVVDFQSAQQKLGQFLIPNTTPVQIPDPRKP